MHSSHQAAADLREIGQRTFQALEDMSIPPTPEFYSVWFSHLQKNNNDLSRDIERVQSEGKPIDEIFLKDIHGKYLSTSQRAEEIEKHSRQVLSQTNQLKDLANTFDNSAKEFRQELTNASEEGAQNAVDPQALMANLLSMAQSAIERNQVLEANLSEATTQISSLQQSFNKVVTDANTDFLTKLHNRRYFEQSMPQLIATTQEENEPLCMIVTDIDHFKAFNDKWGHQVGDQVLKLVSSALRENIKGQDLLARVGGEEFALALPNTKLEDAMRLADNIRIAVSKRKLVNRATNVDLGRVTMSFGVSLLEPGQTSDEVYKEADEALYDAKNSGRNRVCAYVKQRH